MSHNRIRRAVATVAALAAVAVTGVACASDDPVSHNAADVTFSTEMIPHHRQAVEMAQMVPGRSTDPEVAGLARQIAAAQQPEIDQLTTRLRSWGEPVPTGTGHTMPKSGDMSMSGMMSDADMSELRSLSGRAFDQRWLTMMIDHHSGAITMARTEVDTGLDDDSIALARSIISSQQAELTRMRAMLAG
ncbi:DUF305 domain-containing protein [Williamsia herbipolensis]|uniref:DUF305 domain-containing protein n=1 Tax=Williamsia herbipolensis TaxID=1603258 RepID=UPI0005F7C0E4|nr:DUF305 domain-containing protein [Williamsia herbipolensis]